MNLSTQTTAEYTEDLRPVALGAASQPIRTTVDAAAEWRRPLTGSVLGLLLFETVTGFSIYLLKFSVFNQYAVLLHTVLGVLMVFPVSWYLARHWLLRYHGRFNHFQLLGYVSAALLIVLFVSGFVLSWQALFGTRITTGWDLAHIVGSFVFVGALGAHLATLVFRTSGNSEVRRTMTSAKLACLRTTMVWCAAPTLACAGLWASYQDLDTDGSFPETYSFRYGEDRPFAPSLARVDMGHVEDDLKRELGAVLSGPDREVLEAKLVADPNQHVGLVGVADQLCAAMDLSDEQRAAVKIATDRARRRFRETGRIPAQLLAGSAGCGTSGCHSEILSEWLPSAHRYASMDFVFQEVQTNMAKELAPEATRYCAGCHDPIAMFSGAKNVGNETLSAEGADEGVSCLVCHSIVQTDVRGNADYTIRVPERYLYELHEGRLAKAVSDFLIRAYPRAHVASYTKGLYKTAEACGACHKQFIDEELNSFGWVQGQNQYDSWRKSRWHAEDNPSRTIGCRECHMPLMASNDPAAGDVDDSNRHVKDGKHRSHRFLGANQFIPRHHNLPGAEEQCALTVKWLRGEYEIPEIADRWTTGPAVRLTLDAPADATPGQPVSIQTIVTNNKTGHDFPTGPMDMIEAWIEVTVTDAEGDVVFTSSRADEQGYLVNPQIVFKAELNDRQGELIGKHELWRFVGARFKRALFPGFTDATSFVFECPAMPTDANQQLALPPRQDHQFNVAPELASTVLNVTATVWYCKFSAPFLDRLFGKEARQRSEVTEIARAEATIHVRPIGEEVATQ